MRTACEVKLDSGLVAGAQNEKSGAAKRDNRANPPKNSIDALQECSDYGGQKGVVVGVENHGNMSVEQMLYILESVDSSWFGINLDTSNYIVETDDELYDAITRSLPYAVNVQVKVKRKLPDGTKVEVDLKKMISLIKEAGYQGYVVLEYEEEAPREKVPEYIDLLKKIINPS